MEIQMNPFGWNTLSTHEIRYEQNTLHDGVDFGDFTIFLALRSGLSCHCSTWICSIVFSHSLFQEELLLPDQPDSSSSEEETNDVPDPADKECPVEEPDEKGACPVWQITSLSLQPSYLILLHSDCVKLEMENNRLESTPTVSQAMCSSKEHVISLHHTPCISIKGIYWKHGR